MEEKGTWGGYRPGAGRKKGTVIKPASERKTSTLVVKLTPEEKEKLKALAAKEGLSVSGYLLRLALADE